VVASGQAVGRTKGAYLSAQFRRLTARCGKKRASVAVGHTILTIAYYLVTRGTVNDDLGVTYFDEGDRAHVERRVASRLEALGYTVHLQRPPAPAPRDVISPQSSLLPAPREWRRRLRSPIVPRVAASERLPASVIGAR
jgi:hypothetical protein